MIEINEKGRQKKQQQKPLSATLSFIIMIQINEKGRQKKQQQKTLSATLSFIIIIKINEKGRQKNKTKKTLSATLSFIIMMCIANGYLACCVEAFCGWSQKCKHTITSILLRLHNIDQ